MVMEMRRLQIVSAVWSRPTHEASEGQLQFHQQKRAIPDKLACYLIRRCVAGEANLVVG